jgi:hypothetical protein
MRSNKAALTFPFRIGNSAWIAAAKASHNPLRAALSLTPFFGARKTGGGPDEGL